MEKQRLADNATFAKAVVVPFYCICTWPDIRNTVVDKGSFLISILPFVPILINNCIANFIFYR
jgi:hypothetical protein